MRINGVSVDSMTIVELRGALEDAVRRNYGLMVRLRSYESVVPAGTLLPGVTPYPEVSSPSLRELPDKYVSGHRHKGPAPEPRAPRTVEEMEEALRLNRAAQDPEWVDA